ncbi:MAG: GNAT family N-acetyltransferase [Rhodobacteraceae bacterium]|jgi:putative hemolysin|nr:GNAT family N-acetyltransferase [Paracoccaceae bacterium]
MTAATPAVRLATTPAEVEAALALRYRVFVAELGGGGAGVDHGARREQDRFDAVARHLNLWLGERIVATTRLIDTEGAARAGGFYSAGEFDLSPLLGSGRRLLELGRTCLDPDHRGGPAMFHLWNGLADLVLAEGTEILFGVASFHGTDLVALAEPLAWLHHHHLAPPALRVRAIGAEARAMDLVPADRIDRRGAMLATPALIKAYLRLGGVVGEGTWVDHAFNTTDVCLIVDTARMNDRARAIYTRGLPE